MPLSRLSKIGVVMLLSCLFVKNNRTNRNNFGFTVVLVIATSSFGRYGNDFYQNINEDSSWPSIVIDFLYLVVGF